MEELKLLPANFSAKDVKSYGVMEEKTLANFWCSDEQMCLFLSARRSGHKSAGGSPLDEHLFAGLAFLAQHHTLFATPALVQLAKNAKSRGAEGRSIW
jgi:hypothetical protein